MADALTNPHDKFFKDLFSRHEAARDFLQHYLPADIAALLDLSTLQIHKDSFISPDLQEHFSDLLYQVRLKQGQETYIYILFEHKSYPEPLIALQLLRYMTNIWEQALKQNQSLLPIVPVVMYHGLQEWRISPHLRDLFEVPAAIRRYVPDYEYWLSDLSRYSDEEIKGRVETVVILQIGLLLLKYNQRAELGERLREILGLLWQLREQETALEYLETVLRYIVGSTDKVSAQELNEVVREVLQEGARMMPTIAEQWLEQGRAEGREEGLEQGLEQGREEGREATLNLLRRYLATRFEVELDFFDEALARLDLAAINRLSDAAFEAGTLAEFEAVLTELTADQPADQDDEAQPES